VHISVAGPAQFVVFLGQQTAKQRDVEQVARSGAGLGVVLG